MFGVCGGVLYMWYCINSDCYLGFVGFFDYDLVGYNVNLV